MVEKIARFECSFIFGLNIGNTTKQFYNNFFVDFDVRNKNEQFKPTPTFRDSQEQSPKTFNLILVKCIENGLHSTYNSWISTSICIQLGDERPFFAKIV